MKSFASPAEVRNTSYYLTPGSHPNFIDQVADTSRQGLIKSASATEYSLGSDTSISGNVPKIDIYTEQDALSQTMFLLEEAMTNPNIPEDITKRAEDIYENLAFIGEKELAEATHIIADYWKAYLSDHPDKSLFIITSKTFETEDAKVEDSEVQDIDLGYVSDNKSDEYVLNSVLSNFTDEELRNYSSRLLFSEPEYSERDPQEIKTIILDDWIMSGQQMQDTLDRIFEHTEPMDLEINLVISNQDRLANGFATSHLADPIPVKACFVSRAATYPYASEFGGPYLTAAHSSGDYPFEGTIEEIVDAVNKTQSHGEGKSYMPPLTNIVRPYYSPEYRFYHIERVKLLRALGRKSLLGSRIAP